LWDDLVEEVKRGDLRVEELPTGYIFTISIEAVKDLILHRQQRETIQNNRLYILVELIPT
jgi:hypothetical protein